MVGQPDPASALTFLVFDEPFNVVRGRVVTGAFGSVEGAVGGRASSSHQDS
jgi:hypothetical protein